MFRTAGGCPQPQFLQGSTSKSARHLDGCRRIVPEIRQHHILWFVSANDVSLVTHSLYDLPIDPKSFPWVQSGI